MVAGETAQFLDHFGCEWKDDARFTLPKIPSMEVSQGFWNSDEYQAIKHLRTDVIPPNFTFAVESFDAEERAAQNLIASMSSKTEN
ncbi:DUF1330 domain-containing protein [Ruegeria litorea]|uniref:DUF1330 domain-containing protein n=1 Tax=Falsiruegeria litorea TaxID=1280831 RepID=A0ABS5WKV2_9RHOB|nr:DUF1330 domain-containing protein [Falsiruegeria litorea]MBT8169860.1 DUF1330 domain-containing protein [Falsiruegeria litorea]